MTARKSIKAMTAAGLQARWLVTVDGKRALAVRWPKAGLPLQRHAWWYVDQTMLAEMRQLGIIDGFNQCASFFASINQVPTNLGREDSVSCPTQP